MNRVLNVLVVLGVLMGGQAAQAEEKSHKAAAREVLKAMEMESQLQASIDVALNQIAKANPQLAEQKEKMRKFFTKYMGWESMEDDLVRIFVNTYTEDELKDISAFYKTPTGKKMASKMPEVLKLHMELGAKKVQENQADLIRILTER